jgi:hypothetical protein
VPLTLHIYLEPDLYETQHPTEGHSPSG